MIDESKLAADDIFDITQCLFHEIDNIDMARARNKHYMRQQWGPEMTVEEEKKYENHKNRIRELIEKLKWLPRD